jgi:hypothetical protein
VWEQVAELVSPVEEDFRDQRLGLFYYIDALCQGAERLGDRAALPMLERLHRVPLLRGQQCARGPQPDYFMERRSMLELSIGRAMARCGSLEGYNILSAYLSDNRSLLAKNAWLQLRRLTGKSFGLESKTWERWIAEAKPYLRTEPLRMKLDFEADSETLLRRES